MNCPICGAGAAQIESKSGKGSLNKTALVVSGLFGGPIGAALALKESRSKQHGYISCSTCGYDQFATVDPSIILKIDAMEQVGDSTYHNTDIPINSLLEVLTSAASEANIPMNVRIDECNRLSAGLSLASYPCVVVEHPDHPHDYCKFCITKNVDGNRCMLTPYIFGDSPQLRMANYNENVSSHSDGGLKAAALGYLSNKKSSNFLTSAGIGYEVGHYVTSSIIKHNNSKKMDAGALQWEKLWYSEVMDLIGHVLR